MGQGEAETLAARALAWMAGDAALTGRFLALSGIEGRSLRACAGDPEFLGFVLDFLLGEEAALIAFADDEGVPPEFVGRARAALPGGDAPHWT